MFHYLFPLGMVALVTCELVFCVRDFAGDRALSEHLAEYNLIASWEL